MTHPQKPLSEIRDVAAAMYACERTAVGEHDSTTYRAFSFGFDKAVEVLAEAPLPEFDEQAAFSKAYVQAATCEAVLLGDPLKRYLLEADFYRAAAEMARWHHERTKAQVSALQERVRVLEAELKSVMTTGMTTGQVATADSIAAQYGERIAELNQAVSDWSAKAAQHRAEADRLREALEKAQKTLDILWNLDADNRHLIAKHYGTLHRPDVRPGGEGES